MQLGKTQDAGYVQLSSPRKLDRAVATYPPPLDEVEHDTRKEPGDAAKASTSPEAPSFESSAVSSSSCSSFSSFASDESISRTEDPLLSCLGPPSPRAALVVTLPHPKDPPEATIFRAAKTLLSSSELAALPEAVEVGILALRMVRTR